MIKFKIHNSKTKLIWDISIPVCWQEVTFGQYLKILKNDGDILKLVSIVSGLDYEIIKESTIKGLEQLIKACAFLNESPNLPDVTDKLGKYKLPVNKDKKLDIQFESLAQFEDMRKIMYALPENDLMAHINAYGAYCAIYAQKIRDREYDYNAAMDMVEAEVIHMPMSDVIVCGAFFFLKLRSLLTGTEKTSQVTNQRRKKSKRASTSSKKNSGSTRR